jgi:hypothetical protein
MSEDHYCDWCEHCDEQREEKAKAEAAEKWWTETLESWNWDASPLYIAAVLIEWHKEIHPRALDADEDDVLVKAWLKRIEAKFGAENRAQVADMLYQISGFEGMITITAPEFKGWALIDAEYLENV